MYKTFHIIGATGILASGATISGALVNTHFTSHKAKTTNLQFKAWLGPHFPGMGPYGPVGNQDSAKAWPGSPMIDHFAIKISDDSFNYIFDHYIKEKGDSVGYAIYDFLTDAYPTGIFTNWLYDEIKSNADKIFGDVANFVQLTSTHTTPITYKGAYVNIEFDNYYLVYHTSWNYGWQHLN